MACCNKRKYPTNGQMLDWDLRQKHLFNHVSRWRKPEDIGLGDTLNHALDDIGADKFLKMLDIFRIPEGNEDKWNYERPYTSCPISMGPNHVEINPEDALKQFTYNELNPRTYKENSLGLLAVSTISPNHIPEQLKAIISWKNFGFEVVCINTPEEIDTFHSIYPVDKWIEATRTASNGSILISDLVSVAKKLNRQILLLNSDIEIIGRQEQILDHLDPSTTLLGVRWNHHGDYDGRQFQYGIDAITLTPDQASVVPHDMPIPMGMPAWDYILPDLLLKNGYKTKTIHERLFWHKYHLQRWHNDRWIEGMDWYANRFNCSRLDQEFRKRLDPELTYNGYCYVDKRGKRPCVP